MKTLTISLFFSAAAVVPAQPPAGGPPGGPRRIEMIASHEAGVPAGGAMSWTTSDFSFEATNVKGAPFSGDFVTENSQSLADGNRIRTTNTTSYARDGEGRTRREVSFEAIGPWAAGGPRKTIFIHDPVGRVDWVLDPQEKTARKAFGPMFTKALRAPAGEGGKPGHNVVIERRIGNREMSDVMVAGTPGTRVEGTALPPGLVLQGPEGAVVGHRVEVTGSVMATPAIASTSAANFRNESLGKRMIEGVEAEGTRTTVTIPAGQIGNDLPIHTISERWYSNELKTVVMTSRSDPRSGESTYRLTNLRRGEPSPTLFEAPVEYKLIEEEAIGGTIRMKVLEKK